MNSKVSIVIAYQNRFSHLLFTLKTINLFSRKENFEVVVVDYESEETQKASQFEKMFEFPVKVVEIEQKGWVNPCIPNNIAIKQATGDIVIIQNPECFHCGNIVGHAIEHSNDKNYLAYSCYSIDAAITKKIVELGDPKQSFDEVQKILYGWQKTHKKSGKYFIGWYCHPVHRPRAFHFCSAVTKKNIDELGGFDERFAQGYAYDDTELIARVGKKGLQISIVPPEDGVYCVHQWHQIFAPARRGSKRRKNKGLYRNVTLKETTWKVN